MPSTPLLLRVVLLSIFRFESRSAFVWLLLLLLLLPNSRKTSRPPPRRFRLRFPVRCSVVVVVVVVVAAVPKNELLVCFVPQQYYDH